MSTEVSGVQILNDPRAVALCVARDFSGEFVLSVTREDDLEAEPIYIPVKVR